MSLELEGTHLFNKKTTATQSYPGGSTTPSIDNKWGSGSKLDNPGGMFHKVTTTHRSLTSRDGIVILQIHHHCLSRKFQKLVTLPKNNLIYGKSSVRTFTITPRLHA